MAKDTTEEKTAENIPAQSKGGEIVLPGAKYSTEALSAITSFEDALALAGAVVGMDNIVRADQEIGDGFKLLENKDVLIDTPCLFLGWDFHMGDHGEFVAVKVVTKSNEKYIVNDGSTGIFEQLVAFTAKNKRQGGLMVAKGLRRSNYTFTDSEGKEKAATTYYIDTSA